MKITIGEYCRFSLQGRINLLYQYGEIICYGIFEKKLITIFKLFDFHVEVVNELFSKSIVAAKPVVSCNMISFYKEMTFLNK